MIHERVPTGHRRPVGRRRLPAPPRAAPAPDGDDRRIVAALRRGEEQAFVVLVERHQAMLLRVAAFYVHSPTVAEEVVQETWLGVLDGIGRFEERSSLKTWIFRILCNRAKSRGIRERRSVPFSALAPQIDPGTASSPEADRERWPGRWASEPRCADGVPEAQLLARETLDCVRAAIVALPVRQREVIVLRDLTGCDADEACRVLGISAGNQRVLLHRARAKVRAALARHLNAAE